MFYVYLRISHFSRIIVSYLKMILIIVHSDQFVSVTCMEVLYHVDIELNKPLCQPICMFGFRHGY